MNNSKVDLSYYDHSFSLSNKIGRLIWNISYWLLFRPFIGNAFNRYRNFILKVFGAKIDSGSIVHSNVKIWAPWNLRLGNNVCLGPNVDCYNQGEITIGSNTTISQKSYLCASSHNISDCKIPLMLKPIIIKDQVWVAAEAFIGPGIIIEQGAVIGARSAVFRNVDSWTVVGGNPASYLKSRNIKNENDNEI